MYQEILDHLGMDEVVVKTKRVAGGCINNTTQCITSKGIYFIKTTQPPPSDLFEKEIKGLDILHRTSHLRVPKAIVNGSIGTTLFLIMEWIEPGARKMNFWQDFGSSLALQHLVTANAFGLDHHNHIGRLPQSNTNHPDWANFFINERLVPQLKMAEAGNLISVQIRKGFEKLFLKLKGLVPQEPPALLHGDLWSGNFMADSSGDPVIFDPAIHYGHRETELAFTTLFGGFDPSFYEAYQEVYPLEQDFHSRFDIHNLYPLLVHVNLFGSSYLPGIITTLGKFT